jgi:hypothetical protein
MRFDMRIGRVCFIYARANKYHVYAVNGVRYAKIIRHRPARLVETTAAADRHSLTAAVEASTAAVAPIRKRAVAKNVARTTAITKRAYPGYGIPH